MIPDKNTRKGYDKVKQAFLTVNKNVNIARSVYEMTLSGDISAITAPGQFVNLKIEDAYLRRPISVCDYDAENGELTINY